MRPDELAKRLTVAGAGLGDQLRGHRRITSSSRLLPLLPVLTPRELETGRSGSRANPAPRLRPWPPSLQAAWCQFFQQRKATLKGP
jgi:hypothetical protein